MTRPAQVGLLGISQSWAGGAAGRQVIDAFLPQVRGDLGPCAGRPLSDACMASELACAQVGRWLSPQGQLFMVTIAENDPQGGCSLLWVGLWSLRAVNLVN